MARKRADVAMAFDLGRRGVLARRSLAFAALALLFALAAGTAGCAPLQAASWRAAPDFSRLVRENGPAVVNIGVAREASPDPLRGRAQGQDNVDETSLGSGFILSGDGYILTNAHVVARGSLVSVKLTDRREFKARLIGLDAVADVALLKIDATGLPTVKIGDAARVAPPGIEHLVREAFDRQTALFLDRARPAPFVDEDEADALRLQGEPGEERVIGRHNHLRLGDLAAVRLLQTAVEHRASALGCRAAGGRLHVFAGVHRRLHRFMVAAHRPA